MTRSDDGASWPTMARIVWALLTKKRITMVRSLPRHKPNGPGDRRIVGGRRRIWRSSRRDGAGRTSAFHCAIEHASGDAVPVRELPYGSVALPLHQRRDRWQNPTTPHFRNTACTFRGVCRWKVDLFDPDTGGSANGL